MSYTFQRIKELVSPYGCSTVHEQLSRLTQRTEELFLWQQDRESKYVGKSVCNLNVLQCQNNCTREKQELERRLQDAEKQVKGGQEEKKKLLAEKEKLIKELEEKTKAAVQAGYLKEQLNLCMVSKVRDPQHRAPSAAAPGERKAGHILLWPARFSFAITLLRGRGCTLGREEPLQHPQRCQGEGTPMVTASTRSPPQTDAFFDITGSRVPGSIGRSGPFTSPGSYVDALRNQGFFGNTGESCVGARWGSPCPRSSVPSPAQVLLLHPTRQSQRGGDPALGAAAHGAVRVLHEEPQVSGVGGGARQAGGAERAGVAGVSSRPLRSG